MTVERVRQRVAISDPAQRSDLLRSVCLAQSGDPLGPSEIVMTCRESLINFLTQRGASDPEGQAHDVLAEFIGRVPRLEFEHERQIWAYLYRMCRSSLSKDARRGGNEFPVGLVFDDHHLDLSEQSKSVEIELLVEELLNELTPSQQQVLRQRFLEDQSIQDTAKRTGLSELAVKSLQVRGLRSARKALLAAAAATALLLIGLLLNEYTQAQTVETGPTSVESGPNSTETDESDNTERQPDRDIQAVDQDERSRSADSTEESPPTSAVRQDLEVDEANASAQSGLVVLDDFTDGVQPLVGGFTDLDTGGQSGDWTVTAPVSVDHAGHHVDGESGYYLDLGDSGEATRIARGLTPGSSYRLTVRAARHIGVTDASATVEIDGVNMAINPTRPATANFEQFDLTFVASSSDVALTLRGTGSSQAWGGVLVDSVTIASG